MATHATGDVMNRSLGMMKVVKSTDFSTRDLRDDGGRLRTRNMELREFAGPIGYLKCLRHVEMLQMGSDFGGGPLCHVEPDGVCVTSFNHAERHDFGMARR